MWERSWTNALFVLTSVVGSASLFVVQPMCARMVLPHLGGSPSVWTTCMLFFQAGLLGGYAYAHASRVIGFRVHTSLQLVFVAAACAFLPPVIGRPFVPEDGNSPVLWLLASLGVTIGLPYFVLASSAPLLQVWFARGRSAEQRDPYFLYAASNVGSLLGLLAYPFVLEPWMGVQQQSRLWSSLFVVFAVLTAACAVVSWMWGNDGYLQEKRESKAKQREPVSRWTFAKWLFLAFLPSSLLLSVTVHVTADVASIPFLWVLPLGLYLLTYIFAFSGGGAGDRPFWIRWLPLVALVLVTVLLTEATEPLLVVVGLHLAGLFWIGMICHGELARSRPPVSRLTTFYIWIAAGGLLGGVFNAVVAPVVFDGLVEYPAALVLVCLLPLFAKSRRSLSIGTWRSKWDFLFPVLLALLTFVSASIVERSGVSAGPVSVRLIFGVPLIVCYTFAGQPIRFALGILAILIANSWYPGVHGKSHDQIRSFFGVYRVTGRGDYRLFVHGTTEHGRQSLDSKRRTEPLAYYSRTGPIGDLFDALASDDARRRKVAVLGLGAGALAAYAQTDHDWTFYEVDPAVAWIAQGSGYFTFLQDAKHRGARINVVQGDARFRISRADARFGIIIVDAFGSDSIPTHLFTREALQTYRDRLTENGILVIHYSSRYFHLRPVLGALAGDANPPMQAVFREDLWISDEEKQAGKAVSRWAIFLQSDEERLLSGLHAGGWRGIERDGRPPPWTDDHANVLRALEVFPK